MEMSAAVPTTSEMLPSLSWALELSGLLPTTQHTQKKTTEQKAKYHFGCHIPKLIIIVGAHVEF